LRGWISWGIWAFLMLIFLLIPVGIARSAFRALPHDRALASAYAASPDCESSTLLRAGPQLSPGAPSAAPAGPLCEVRRMTVVEKWHTSARFSSYEYSLILSDDAGRRFVVSLSNVYFQFWSGLRPQAKVNAQWVDGEVAMIADGAKLVPTADNPGVVLRASSVRFYIAGIFSIPFLALLGLSVNGWVKKSRRRGFGDMELSEKEARAWREPLGAALPSLDCPNYQGRPLAEARQELEAVGYKVGRITFLPSPSLTVGTVVAQTPPPGSKVAPGAAFNFQVSIEGKT
jgi:PASTA domain